VADDRQTLCEDGLGAAPLAFKGAGFNFSSASVPPDPPANRSALGMFLHGAGGPKDLTLRVDGETCMPHCIGC
jgi:hypothetical protein